MPKYRKLPVEVDAIQVIYGKTTIGDVIAALGSNPLEWDGSEHFIQTLGGRMVVCDGDFVIKGVAGEFYPRKPDIFHATYEEAAVN
ncbi:hypothetical protein ABH892_004467 [Paenibacillus sp. RC254]|uniref:hypothetical protein n=1 Tax=unclassified Paenibacillus TaxID=185978 RepID=UPI0024B9F92D|nr:MULTISPECIES: hypothetical protein [unclassified Paenibacillus]